MPSRRLVSRAAHEYEAREWGLIPLGTRDKKPLIQPAELQSQRSTKSEVSAWYRRWPRANVGILTGVISDLVVLDMDPRQGGDASLFELEKAHEPLPHTVEAHTGGGGRHIYMRHPGGSVPDGVLLAPGLEIRGDGGFVVAPPSMHPSGRRYVWDAAHQPDDAPVCDMPDWLRSKIDDDGDQADSRLRDLACDGVSGDDRASAMASLSDHLSGFGVDPVIVRELMRGWNQTHCDPPLDETIFPLSGK